MAGIVNHEHEYQSRQHGSIAVPGQPVNLPGLRQIPESLVLHTPAAPVRTAHLNSVKAGPQAGDVLRCRDVLAMPIQDGGPVGMGLLGYHHVHRNCAVRRFVADQRNRSQRRGSHPLRLPPPGKLALFLETAPTPVLLLPLPLDRFVDCQFLVPYPADEVDAVVLLQFAELGMCLTHVATSACGLAVLSLPGLRPTISSYLNPAGSPRVAVGATEAEGSGRE